MGTLYIHIPFCLSKCRYCDFLSAPAPENLQRRYAQALLKDIQWQWSAFPERIEAIFIGGGTPSLLARGIWQGLLQGILDLSDGSVKEWTVEANPGDLSEGLLQDWRAAGVNRLSMGVQSFDDETLRLLGRRHTAGQAAAAYAMARKAGFENINLDLMYGLPGMQLANWQKTVQEALALAPDHLSLYGLIVEEGTPMASDISSGLLPEPSEETARQAFLWQREALACAGYEAYEISNFAQPSYACRHNQNYWALGNWLGCGLGASGHLKGTFTRMSADMDAYLARLEAGQLPIDDQESWDRPTLMSETVILALRTTEGLSARAFAARYGERFEQRFAAAIDTALQQKLAVWDGDYFKATPEGLLLNNTLGLLFL